MSIATGSMYLHSYMDHSTTAVLVQQAGNHAAEVVELLHRQHSLQTPIAYVCHSASSSQSKYNIISYALISASAS